MKVSRRRAPSDPLSELDENTREHIYQYLSGNDVLNLFLVSKEWNQLACKSSAAMKKIKLNFRETFHNNPSTQEVTAVLQSERQYQNVDTIFNYLANVGRKLLLLQRFSPSIIDLEFVFVRNVDDFLPPNLSFPKLKTLKAHGSDSVRFNATMIRDSTDIEKISIDMWTIRPELISCMMQKTKLKELKFSRVRNTLFENHSLENAQFKLNCFSLKNENYGYQPSIHARANFNRFVLQMADTLKSLEIDDCFSDTINLVLNQLPVLERFHIVHLCGIVDIQYNPNERVKEFRFRHFDSLEVFHQILLCFTGLEMLKVKYIDNEDLEMIVRNMKTLKNLQFESWIEDIDVENINDLESVQDVYDQLKAEDATINGNIEISISDF